MLEKKERKIAKTAAAICAKKTINKDNKLNCARNGGMQERKNNLEIKKSDAIRLQIRMYARIQSNPNNS